MSRYVCITKSARHLLNPRSELSQQYPALHYSFHNRLREAWSLRGHQRISRCVHNTFNGYQIGRSDGQMYQKEENSQLVDMVDPIANDTSLTRVDKICTLLGKRVQIYGILGSGTFGVVYLARSAPTEGVKVHPYDVKHYAIKVERHSTYDVVRRWYPIAMVPIWDPDVELLTYIPTEALALFLLTHSERFPNLDSVYTHDRFQSIVMSASLDSSEDRRKNVRAEAELDFFPSFTGVYLLNGDGTPLLNEMQACKVASQLLQAIVHMAEFNLVHVDISVNNFIVDQNLDVQLIDLGNIWFGTEDKHWTAKARGILPFQEYQITPQLAAALVKNDDLLVLGMKPVPVVYEEDRRQTCLWNFGVILYGMLHGYWPWDTPEETMEWDLLDYIGGLNERVYDRRCRMCAMELPIDPKFSKDCMDVLKYIFQADPKFQGTTVTLETLVTFPWFTQWLDLDVTWERPHSKQYVERYAEPGAREA